MMKKDLIYKAINEILLKEWDPIGLNSFPKDEYSGYVPTIYKKMKNGTNLKGLSDLLLKIESTSLGVVEDVQRCDIAAEKLLKIEL
ncbi:MAG: hypothetical protein JXQ93_10855 [Flavobacteriaceae bacterium]